MDEVVGSLRRAVRPARGEAEGHIAQGDPARARVGVAPPGPVRPEGPARRSRMRPTPAGSSSTRPQRQRVRGAQGCDRPAQRHRAVGAGAGDGDEGRAQAGRAARLPPRQPGPARARRSPGGSSACSPDPRPPAFKKGSGRLELARAIADPKNPLTARVLVNRVWHWHFGKGLVTTPSDFGLRSDPPSHPELLDYLAAGFIADGWSIKALHRRIMLSSTYQQSSAPAARRGRPRPREPAGLAVQPAAARFRVDARLGPGGLRRPRPDRRRPARDDHRGPVPAAADGLRLHRPPEPRRSLPHVRLRRARRHQPAAVRHDGAAAGPLPDEQPVPARTGAPAGRDGPPGCVGRPDRRHPPALSPRIPPGTPSPTSWRWPRSSSAASPARRPAPPADGWKRFVTSKAGEALSPWEQLAQVLMLTNEFMFEE